MRRRLALFAVVLAALGAGIGLWFRDAKKGTMTSPWGDEGEAAFGRTTPPPPPPGAASVDLLLEGGPLHTTLHDRAVRDEMRRRILAAWAASPDEEVRTAAKQGRFVPIPDDPDASRAYLRQVVKDDFVPLAKECYSELLGRNKRAGGRIEISFKIVGDEKIGGVIDEAQVTAEGGVDDPELLTCIRESFLSLSFRPPPSGWMTVTYPLIFAPGEDEPDR